MESGRLGGFEFEDNRIALIECQLARSGPRLRDFQLVDLFIQPQLLKERMRLGQARLFVEEGASADLGRFQRTLKENDAAQPIARGVDQQGGVMLRLCGPKAIDIKLQMAALGIEIKDRSEEHKSELQSLLRLSYAVFCFN